MNLLKIAIATFSATNFMAAFSYLMATCFKKLFHEPVMMYFALKSLGIELKCRLNKAAGCFAHYAIGFAMAICYESLWRYTAIDFGFLSGILFGMASGLIGIAGGKSTSHRFIAMPEEYIIILNFSRGILYLQ